MSHPFDCWITPPCAAIALGRWFCSMLPPFDLALDPFAGPATLVPWTGLAEHAHARELDPRWESEARTRAVSLHIGDSLASAWLIDGRAPHIVTNPPYGLTREAIERCRNHAYEHRRWACLLLRTDWWQHRNRSHLRPDHMLMLEWRPAFGLNSKQRLATDYAGYSWACWMPAPTGRTSMSWLPRPEVPAEQCAEHKRLAMLAYHMGQEMAQGA